MTDRKDGQFFRIKMMILKAYNKSEIARLYFQKKGENLTKQVAANRWRMVTPDADILKAVFKDVYDKQKREIDLL
jgi:hypothetical protein